MPSGSCLCGEIKYEYAEEAVKESVLCHCKDCKKSSGSAFTSNVILPTSEFRVLQGAPKVFTVNGLSGLPHPRFFCGNCGSSLYDQPSIFEGATIVKAGTLEDGASKIVVTKELFFKDRNTFVKQVEGATQAEMMS